MTRCARAVILLAAMLLVPNAMAEGHGPVFALATPTLGKGGASSDTVMMGLRTEDGSAPTTLGQMFGYGLNEDLQFNFRFPLARSGRADGLLPNMRSGMMGAPRATEAQLMWRFHRRAPAIGTRRESTLHVGIATPDQAQRRGLNAGESLNVAVATGYASRQTYWWLSAGAETHREKRGDQLGDLYYAGAVFGYRPNLFRRDVAPLDFRWFAEVVAEFPQPDQRDGQTLTDTGGERLLAGPSFLALSGPWGLSGGVLFPLHEDMNAAEPDERYRAKLVVTYWF